MFITPTVTSGGATATAAAGGPSLTVVSTTPVPVPETALGFTLEFCLEDAHCRDVIDPSMATDPLAVCVDLLCVCSDGFYNPVVGDATLYICVPLGADLSQITITVRATVSWTADCADFTDAELAESLALFEEVVGVAPVTYSVVCGSVHLIAEFRISALDFARFVKKFEEELPSVFEKNPALQKLGKPEITKDDVRGGTNTVSSRACDLANAVQAISFDVAGRVICTALKCAFGHMKVPLSTGALGCAPVPVDGPTPCVLNTDCAGGTCVSGACLVATGIPSTLAPPGSPGSSVAPSPQTPEPLGETRRGTSSSLTWIIAVSAACAGCLLCCACVAVVLHWRTKKRREEKAREAGDAAKPTPSPAAAPAEPPVDLASVWVEGLEAYDGDSTECAGSVTWSERHSDSMADAEEYLPSMGSVAADHTFSAAAVGSLNLPTFAPLDVALPTALVPKGSAQSAAQSMSVSHNLVMSSRSARSTGFEVSVSPGDNPLDTVERRQTLDTQSPRALSPSRLRFMGRPSLLEVASSSMSENPINSMYGDTAPPSRVCSPLSSPLSSPVRRMSAFDLANLPPVPAPPVDSALLLCRADSGETEDGLPPSYLV